MNEPVPAWAWISLTLALFASGIAVGYAFGRDAVEREAVKAGSAEWAADPDGNAEIVWR
jgi:hypothetical protein